MRTYNPSMSEYDQYSVGGMPHDIPTAKAQFTCIEVRLRPGACSTVASDYTVSHAVDERQFSLL